MKPKVDNISILISLVSIPKTSASLSPAGVNIMSHHLKSLLFHVFQFMSCYKTSLIEIPNFLSLKTLLKKRVVEINWIALTLSSYWFWKQVIVIFRRSACLTRTLVKWHFGSIILFWNWYVWSYTCFHWKKEKYFQ